ncbi:DNA polymerase III subunit delta [Aeribacillus alveayuensis]|uniref:DNA polymerase III subunit delta n=1 Tax=Aeribacillus alveayuensis TaxID=279215 RepID=A0ABT9VJX9_9BACI|nr:DNA polymerase-3 subunit delta [Bacillus alveayuensis]
MIVKIWNELKHKNFKPIYVFYGKETFLLSETVRLLQEHTIPEEERDFNFSMFDMEETEIDTAIEDAETLPFMGEKRVVVIKNPYFLSTEKKKEKVEHHLEKFERYIEEPSPFTILALIAPYEKLDERKKITKLLKKKANVVEMNELSESETIAWMNELARQEDVLIEQSAIDQLFALTSGNLMIISSEMKKLCTYVGKGNTITEEDVKKLVARTLEQNIFELIDYVIQKKKEKALELFYHLLKMNEEPIKILNLMASQFRLLYQVKQLGASGYTQPQIASILKVHPYRVKLAYKQAKMFQDHELTSIIQQLAEADFEMKAGKMDKQLVLELLLMKRFQT